MTKISVYFFVPDRYEDCDDTYIPVAKITPAQLEQLLNTAAKARRPENSCPSGMTLRYEEGMTFPDYGPIRDRITEHYRQLRIQYLFGYSDGNMACGVCKRKKDIAMMRHCARNLRAGNCQDPFMRNTIGAILFPKLYTKEK